MHLSEPLKGLYVQRTWHSARSTLGDSCHHGCRYHCHHRLLGEGAGEIKVHGALWGLFPNYFRRIQKHLVSYGGADHHHEMDVALRIPHVSYHRGGQGSARGWEPGSPRSPGRPPRESPGWPGRACKPGGDRVSGERPEPARPCSVVGGRRSRKAREAPPPRPGH